MASAQLDLRPEFGWIKVYSGLFGMRIPSRREAFGRQRGDIASNRLLHTASAPHFSLGAEAVAIPEDRSTKRANFRTSHALQPAGRLYERIATEIRHAITNGYYKGGDRLPSERELAQHYGISRHSTREAIIALELDGLVEAKKNSGIYVTALTRDGRPLTRASSGPFELLEARRLFEAEICALAAERIERTRIDWLHELVDLMASGDLACAEAADREFHLEIARATQNSAMETAVSMMWEAREKSPRYAAPAAEARLVGVAPRVPEHRRIVIALEAGDPVAAREAMHDHLERVIAELLEVTEVEAIARGRKEVDTTRHRLSARSKPGKSCAEWGSASVR